jgi:hypothetical protein
MCVCLTVIVDIHKHVYIEKILSLPLVFLVEGKAKQNYSYLKGNSGKK